MGDRMPWRAFMELLGLWRDPRNRAGAEQQFRAKVHRDLMEQDAEIASQTTITETKIDLERKVLIISISRVVPLERLLDVDTRGKPTAAILEGMTPVMDKPIGNDRVDDSYIANDDPRLNKPIDLKLLLGGIPSGNREE